MRFEIDTKCKIQSEKRKIMKPGSGREKRTAGNGLGRGKKWTADGNDDENTLSTREILPFFTGGFFCSAKDRAKDEDMDDFLFIYSDFVLYYERVIR